MAQHSSGGANSSLRQQERTSAPLYCLDPGGNAGLRLPDGTYVLHGKHLRTDRPIKGYTMTHVLKDLQRLPPGPIRIEGARLANSRGLTKEFVQRIIALGYEPVTCNTRDAYKDRATYCASGHQKKSNKPCDGCTVRDLDAMAARGDKYFYPLRIGRPKTSRLAAAKYDALLNEDRFEKPTPYVSLQGEAPAWLLATYEPVIAATLFRGAQTAVEYGMLSKGMVRLIGLHQHARRCQSYANIANCKYKKNILRRDARRLLFDLKTRASGDENSILKDTGTIFFIPGSHDALAA